MFIGRVGTITTAVFSSSFNSMSTTEAGLNAALIYSLVFVSSHLEHFTSFNPTLEPYASSTITYDPEKSCPNCESSYRSS